MPAAPAETRTLSSLLEQLHAAKVTEFFCDPELFAYLRGVVLPEIVAAAGERNNEIRLWSAGCGTGEEAYSLAILLAEVLGEELERFTVRLFATDLDAAGVAYARRGSYPASALAPLPRDLVERYFVPFNGGYMVSERVRSLVIFGEHDLGQRAPFPHIDLCLCRNVLIHFTPALQRRALQLFAFSLRDGGYLVLGKSETPEPLAKFFAPAHPRLKIYRRQGDRMLIPDARIKDTTPLRLVHGLAGTGRRAPGQQVTQTAREAPRPRTSTGEAALLWALPWGALVVDRHYDIQTINPAARRLLGIHGPGLGEDLLHLTERLPVPGLRAAIDAVRDGAAGRELLLAVETAQGEQRYLQLLCRPYTRTGEAAEQQQGGSAEGRVLILVADVTALEDAQRAREEVRAQELAALQEALERVQEGQVRLLLLLAHMQEGQVRQEECLRRAAELNRELEAANEQLSAANAELRSANEEFRVGSEETQTAMDEIETLNEEMQATNEELETLTEELQATVEELHTTNDDLQARNLEMEELAAQREEQRQRSEAERARLVTVLLSRDDAVFVVDRIGAVVLANAAVQRLLGPGGADVVPQDENGQPLPAEQTPRARAARGETFSMTFTLPGADGGRRWFEATGQPIQSEGTGQGSMVAIRNITERSLRRMEEAAPTSTPDALGDAVETQGHQP